MLIDELEWVLNAYGIYNLDSFTLDVSDLGALAGVMDEDEFRKACPSLAAVEHWDRRANDAVEARPYYEADLRRAVSDMMNRRANDAD